MYAELKNQNRQIMGITGQGKKGWAPVQDGAKELLLCEDCEQHINEHYEKPFKAFWLDNSPLPDPWQDEDPRWITTDYKSFKLFHLSVLFRASISSLPMYSAVDLGPHTDRLRIMLLNEDPGREYEYPIGGYGVIHHENRQLIKMITKPQSFRLGGKPCYAIMYGGVEWWFSVSSERNPKFDQFSLKEDGRICLAAHPWTEVAAVQKASMALRSAGA
ncbi:hypothetical protein [Undibacterium sp. WLX3042]|uniref:hypothetical protein n=1 Tax=Undibacterium sp. WLX3042 TaxID=3412686 RepID=UPI003C2B5FD1